MGDTEMESLSTTKTMGEEMARVIMGLDYFTI